jgi:uncharacterized protein (DUF1684 family)
MKIDFPNIKPTVKSEVLEMKEKKLIQINIILALISFTFSLTVNAQTSYQNEVSKWRSEHETELKSENSWFSIAGLFWLKDGVNTIGRGEKFDIQLTENFKGGKFGEILFQNGTAKLKVENGVESLVEGKSFSEIELNSDEKGKPTIVQTGSQTFYLIKREEKFGIRLKDKNNPARLNFKGLHWFSIDSKYKTIATFEPFSEPKEILIPNMLGGNYKMKSEGILKFKLSGKKYSLQPVEEDGKFFIIFRDLTSKKETYGVGRFLYAEKSKDGKIILDFNKAENPPCAYTTFATCPIPPQQNRLPIAIKAGEKRYDH